MKTRNWIVSEYRMFGDIKLDVVSRLIVEQVPIKKTKKDIVLFLDRIGKIIPNFSFRGIKFFGKLIFEKEETVSNSVKEDLKYRKKIRWREYKRDLENEKEYFEIKLKIGGIK